MICHSRTLTKCPPFRYFEQTKHVHSRNFLVYKFFGLHLILVKKDFNFRQRPFFYFIVWSSPEFGKKNTSICGEDLFLWINKCHLKGVHLFGDENMVTLPKLLWASHNSDFEMHKLNLSSWISSIFTFQQPYLMRWCAYGLWMIDRNQCCQFILSTIFVFH